MAQTQFYTSRSYTGSMGGAGSPGGTGLYFNQVGTLHNAFNTRGGAGGYGGGEYETIGVAGGAGGVGIDLGAQATLKNTGSFVGGKGGASYGARGGDGGAGLVSSGGSVVDNYNALNGGDGGRGGPGFDAANYGNGGAGVSLSDAELMNAEYATILGGVGAVGGDGVDLSSNGSLMNFGAITGGQGIYTSAVGVRLDSQATLTNYGVISGGYSAAQAGHGSAGVGLLLDAGTAAENYGTIMGGYAGNGADGGPGVEIDGGTLTSSGTLSGGLVEVDPADNPQVGAAVDFSAGRAGVLVLDGNWKIHGDIDGFKVGDTIDLSNIPLAGNDFNPATYTFMNGTAGQSLQFAGNFSHETFVFSAIDNQMGTEITLKPACFRRGTRILTAFGEAAIENLHIGDDVLTLSGAARPIRWIGRRNHVASVVASNPQLLPVLIRRGALGSGRPARDLWVSAEHAMWIEGMLIPAHALMDGVTIVQDRSVTEITYFHLEFDTHDVIFAEQAPTESFVDDDSRDCFDNANEYRERYPATIRTAPRFCAPRVEDGEELESVRLLRGGRRPSLPAAPWFATSAASAARAVLVRRHRHVPQYLSTNQVDEHRKPATENTERNPKRE